MKKTPGKRLKARTRRLQRIARHRERILQFAKNRTGLTVQDIQDLLHVSNSSARRYHAMLKNEHEQ